MWTHRLWGPFFLAPHWGFSLSLSLAQRGLERERANGWRSTSVISTLSDSSSPQNSLLRMSEFDQDCKMIMFSLQVDCELNLSGWQPRSISFSLSLSCFFLRKFPSAEAINRYSVHISYRIFWTCLVGKISSNRC